MTTYTDVFGGANIYPSEISYSAITLTADLTLHWPEETSAAANFVTRIIDVTAASGPFALIMPSAQETSTGQTVLLNNVGVHPFVVRDAAGAQIVSVAAGTLWQIYLTDNTTAAGSWRALQYGAATSSANASALAGTGLIAIGAVLSQSVPVTQFNSSYTASATDRARMFVWTGASGTFTLPSAPTVGNNWFCYLRNDGSGDIVADPAGPLLINGSATIPFHPGDSAAIICDGTAFYTLGFGQSAVFAFDYTSIDVAGTGNYTLAGTELNRIAYSFTGVLTGDRTVLVPALVQQYWVSNNTTGAYTLTVKTAAGTGIEIAQSARRILFCDGVDVLTADTGGISVPIAVSDGGTGATTPGSALINLGGTSLGTALFTAASPNAAWSALGTAPAGVVNGGAF